MCRTREGKTDSVWWKRRQ